jgi:hypothetical protein
MSTLIKIYNGTVTSGAKDGAEVSVEGSQVNPVSVSLNAAKAETKAIKLAVRCDEGYKTTEGEVTEISAYYYDGTSYNASGGNIGKWQFAKDEGFADAATAIKQAVWGSKLTINDVIGDTNVIFWVKASSDKTELPSNDTSTALHLHAVVESV